MSLSPKEFAVLEVLMRAESRVVSAEELLEKAWDENTDPFTNAVRVAVLARLSSVSSSSCSSGTRCWPCGLRRTPGYCYGTNVSSGIYFPAPTPGNGCASQTAGKVPVRLDELAAAVLDAHKEMAENHGVTLRRKLNEIQVPGDPVLLERLIANLVSNAIGYNDPGGWVEVVVTGGPAEEPVITISNTGQNVPAEAVPALLEPFRRLGADRVRNRGGVGLGLAIVRSIVAAHQGTLQVRSRPGGGLIVEIELPGRQ